ncbi:MAG: adenine phosphoribosyltransferase [Cyanobacteriota bacterium]|nr:adenine phosphoribosyltransferase [Cyanobacteriota bacterium]
MPTSSVDLRRLVRDIPDFPKPGILFRDLTPLMRDIEGWQEVIRQLSAVCERLQPDLIVGIESRGFLVGMALATMNRLGFVPVRKRGKLPGPVTGVDYTLEYGTDRLEIHSDALSSGQRVLVIDDLLATGGTAAACAELVEAAGGSLCGFGFVAELAALDGRRRLPREQPVESLIIYS